MFLSASLSAIADQPLRALRTSGLVRGVLGLLLLSAAGLKAHAFWSETAQPIMLLSSPRAQVAIIETEALLGLWLMTGLYVRAARWIALSFFGVLASVSLYLAFLGESSCGCFGRVQVNPWFSFAIDVRRNLTRFGGGGHKAVPTPVPGRRCRLCSEEYWGPPRWCFLFSRLSGSCTMILGPPWRGCAERS